MLEELVIPEMRIIQFQVYDIRSEVESIRDIFRSGTNSIMSETKTVNRSHNKKMDTIIELLEDLSKQVRALNNSF